MRLAQQPAHLCCVWLQNLGLSTDSSTSARTIVLITQASAQLPSIPASVCWLQYEILYLQLSNVYQTGPTNSFCHHLKTQYFHEALAPATCAPDSVLVDNYTRWQLLGPFHGAIAVPSVTRVVVVVVVVDVVDIARRLRYSYSWRATSDTWWLAM